MLTVLRFPLETFIVADTMKHHCISYVDMFQDPAFPNVEVQSNPLPSPGTPEHAGAHALRKVILRIPSFLTHRLLYPTMGWISLSPRS